jgi:predicted amidohydrolase YtcJ
LVVTYLSSAIDQTSIPIAPWVGALKAFADGPLGSGTAYFYEPFLNQGSNRGLLSDEMHPISLMRDRFMKADAAGLQICTHAIGDEGISIILDLYAEVIKAHGETDRRLRIEHAQHMAAKDFERFAQLHVIASVQPYHAIDDGRFAERTSVMIEPAAPTPSVRS